MVSPQLRGISVEDRSSGQQSASAPPVFKAFVPIAQTALLHLNNRNKVGHSPLCAYGLHSALYMVRIHMVPQDKNACTAPRAKQLLQKYPRFVAALWAFMCTPHTRKELMDLDDALSECHCKYSGSTSRMAMLHRSGHGAEEANDPFKAAIAMGASLLGACIFTLPQGSLDNPDAHIKSQSLSYETMFLYLIRKPDVTVKALATWYEYTRSSDILLFVAFALKQRPAFKTSMVRSRAFLSTTAEELGRIVSMLKIGQRLSYEDKRQLGTFNHFFTFVIGTIATPVIAEWFSEDGVALYEHFYFLIHQDIFDDSLIRQSFRDDSPRDRMWATAAQLRSLLPDAESLGPPLELVRNPRDHMNTIGIGQDMPRIVRIARESGLCYHLDCSSNQPDASPLTNCPLPRCKGCSVFTFCSPECQRLAWDADLFPHKELCPVLRRIYDTWSYYGKDMDTIPDEQFIDRLLAQEGLSRHVGPREAWTPLILEVLEGRRVFFMIFGTINTQKMGMEEEDLDKMIAPNRIRAPPQTTLLRSG